MTRAVISQLKILCKITLSGRRKLTPPLKSDTTRCQFSTGEEKKGGCNFSFYVEMRPICNDFFTYRELTVNTCEMAYL